MCCQEITEYSVMLGIKRIKLTAVIMEGWQNELLQVSKRLDSYVLYLLIARKVRFKPRCYVASSLKIFISKFLKRHLSTIPLP